ncbi:histidine kinase [Blastococcus sp. TBT05-19]|uniref:SpoIIE family protein phosphatase n=1 Tax=Blastococcus sp. TBT05-19 TaxID=2250581 RepID=UPI000DE93806|nr:SpoIIE family protein phosphatase [Blastococcus sp. TBT05-19]RBY94522.1 histidine kinase [Blastococcus sp. TBT05-19]
MTELEPGRCLLVGGSQSESAALAPLAPELLDGAALLAQLSAHNGQFDLVILGSAVVNPIAVVQKVHRQDSAAQVAVLTDQAVEVRRQASFAPGVPLELLVAGPAEPDLLERLQALRAAAVERRRHEAVLAAVMARSTAEPAAAPAALAQAGGLLSPASAWELLTLAIDAAGIGTFDWDLVTGTLSWDTRLIELFGYDVATFDRTIESFNARLHPDDVDRVGALLEHAIETTGDYSAEYRVVLPDGTQRWVAARGRALPDEAGTAVRLLGAAWDISVRREAQDRVAALVESMAIGFIAMDASWVMTHVNEEAERITMTPRTELLGRTLWEAFPATVGTEFETNYRRATSTGRPVVFEAFYPAPLNIWVEVRAVPTPDGLALYFLDISTRRRAQELAERATERERLLSRITEQLSTTLDADEAAERLTRLLVPAVADWCIVSLVHDEENSGDHRALRSVTSWHHDPERRAAVDSYAKARLGVLHDDSLVVRAMRTGQVHLLAEDATARAREMIQPGPVRDLLDGLAPNSIAVLPLPGRNGTVGMLTLCTGPDRATFTSEDLVAARHVAARAGVVLDSARLYRQQRQLAEGFQRSLLTPPPQPDHVQIVVRYVPAAEAAEVGGDWYDAFLQPSGATVLVIGDVVGHDVQAAAAMGQARTIVRALAARDSDGPVAVLSQVERVMQTLQSEILATAVVARLEQEDAERKAGWARLRWTNAGHPPPMVIFPDGQVEVLEQGRPDLLLGVRPDAPRRESQVSLPWHSVVFFYTDGLVESRHEDIDHGLARLRSTLGELAGGDLDDLCDEVLARMLPGNPGDDVALLAIQLHPQDRPRPVRAGPNRLPPDVAPD